MEKWKKRDREKWNKRTYRRIDYMYIRRKMAKSSDQSDDAECGIFNRKFKNSHLGRGRFNINP